MNKEPRDIKIIFSEALEIKNPQDRIAYLDQACGQDEELRAKIEQLLTAHNQAGSFFNDPNVGSGSTLDNSPLAEKAGTIIGRYKLLEKIGEGGMATVYMAEREQPIHRKVALKIIKLGMDTKQVIARFEVERQALALMEHPHIAKILDAGTTETGRPYFVMELVKGIPITKYCDNNNLSTRERLELFIQVCGAIQHAHQKGIIHRDIKPSNVLVALHDGKPVPKIIDFGIAKATQRRLTEKTLFTQFSQLIGTPEYMSPEQAEWSDLDIDTRTDIYSLGVLLYELLTSTTPFDAQELRQAGYSKMQKIICEGEPTKPSTKLSGLGETLAEVARHRKTSPDLLHKMVRGDLDWIVMKCLEKNRTRRYATAGELAADIERNLNHEPVQAAAPSVLYKVRKFVRRNRLAVIAGLLIAATLMIGFSIAIYGLVQANTQRKQAEINFQIAEKQRQSAEINFENARQAVDAMVNYAQDMADIPQMEYLRRSILEEAVMFHQGFLQERSADSGVQTDLALTYLKIGDIQYSLDSPSRAEEAYAQAISQFNLLLKEDPDNSLIQRFMARCHRGLGMLYYNAGDYEGAERQWERVSQTSQSSIRYKFKMLIESMQRRKEIDNHNKLSFAPVTDPNTLGLVVLRMGQFPKVNPKYREYRESWIIPLALQSDWYKVINRPPDAITIVVPNSLANQEGISWVNPEQFGYGFRDQYIIPSSEFKSISERMALTQMAIRPDENTADNRIVFFRDYQLWFSTTQVAHDDLSEVFEGNVDSELIKVYDNMCIGSMGGRLGKVPRDFSGLLHLETPFLYDPAEGNLLLDFRTASGPEFPIVIDAHMRQGLGANGIFAWDHDAKVAGLRCGGPIRQFTFVPVSCLENDPVIMLEILSNAMLVQGPVEKIQLHVKSLKRSGLAPDVTNKVNYSSQVTVVAQVNQSGLITPVAPGVSKIIVSYTDPVSRKAFRESTVIEVVRQKDVTPTNNTKFDELSNKLLKIPMNLGISARELKENQRR